MVLLKLNVDLYPESANVYDSYGEALYAIGDGETAVASFQAMLVEGIEVTALDLAPDDGDLLHFEVDLAREDGDWMITGHQQEGVFER